LKVAGRIEPIQPGARYIIVAPTNVSRTSTISGWTARRY
jgi:hypothetical protein